MSIFGSMKTAVSGMNAQSNRLGTVGDNIANSSTIGYKRASTSFSSMVLPSTSGSYSSGGVQTNVRYSISDQGGLTYTTSTTDLAIQGGGFFIVSDPSGTPYLSRAGSFVPDDTGALVNNGYTLMGYPYSAGAPAAVVNGFDGLEPVNIKKSSLISSPTKNGTFPVNLNADAKAIDTAGGDLAASTNDPNAKYTDKTSLVAYDSLGRKVLYDFYYTKTDDNTWEVAVYRQDTASPGGFPYQDPPGCLNSETLTFDGTTGALTGTATGITFTDPLSPPSPVGQEITISFAGSTQKAYPFTPGNADVDGSAPSGIKSVSIDEEGIVYAVYEDGEKEPLYRIPLATVQSPDNLTPLSGNVFAQGNNSGIITTGFPGSANFGVIKEGALENSNVDIATELTEMIEAQRIYTANSKVFQTGSDLMDVLINLKR